MSTCKEWAIALNQLLQNLSAKPLSREDLLDALAQFCVDDLDAAFARIWLIDDTKTTLVLKTSRGQYTRLDGSRSRIAVGQGSKIDKIYVQAAPHITNDVLNDPGVKDKEWAKSEGMVAFAGYPLVWCGETLGVLGMYSRVHLSEDLLIILGLFATMAAAVIFQLKQTERNLAQFCDVTGFKPALLDRLIRLGHSPRSNEPHTIAV
ncbi:MAG: GAF domain-containing protein [Anaerolineae bacterium]